MKTISRHLKPFSLTVAVALIIASPAMAEDIEVYVGSTPVNTNLVRPNITFIIDTSGSMSTVDVPDTEYEPGHIYAGSCGSSRIYWSNNSTLPSCSGDQYINSSTYNACNASLTALGTTDAASGYYSDRFYQLNSKTWGPISSSQHKSKIECRSDWGVNGNPSSDPTTATYPVNSNTGWQSGTTGAINKDTTGGVYTVYSGNYLNYRANPVPVNITRLKAVQKVFKGLINSLPTNLNIAVMRYDDKTPTLDQGGYFVMPMQQLTDSNRQSYIDTVNAFSAVSWTPLAETLYEAYLFYRGDTMKFGALTTPTPNVAGVLDPTNNSKYKSPIEYGCQGNYVVFLTDGEPTHDTNADAAIKALPGFSAATGSASCSGNCMDELAQYMNSQDCRTSLGGTQTVQTYTIGFGQDVVHANGQPMTAAETLLSNTATKGGGKFKVATTTADLTDVFNNLLIDIIDKTTTVAAPAASVNAFNRLAHRDELYFSVFQPTTDPRWYGNVKKFKSSNGTIVDTTGANAVDANTGFFLKDARSYWTPDAEAPDGTLVKNGGAASQLALPRKVYTYTGSTAPSNVVLTASDNALTEANTTITKTMLGDAAMTDARRTSLLQWARGVDVLDEDTDQNFTDVRHFMGAPLHAKPLLITYGGTELSPDITLYVGTNEGNLAAIDAATGAEKFSFIPQELLPNIAKLYDNTATPTEPVIYGLDGPLTTLAYDAKNDRTVTRAEGDYIYLYQGMRRGGRNYYALDVTDRSAPTLKWMIAGGSGNFKELAQSWSAASKATIKLNGTTTKVLIFGGGYDPAQDSNTTVQNDTMGRAVYMVNALTGEKIWQAGPAGSGNATGGNPELTLADMKYSIPSDVAFFDINGDGFDDRMYVGDMGGQVWRFDIDNDHNTGKNNLVTGGVIARLGDTTEAGNRRFYASPDISLAKDRSYLNIAIGSGYHEHPLSEANQDGFFVIRDKFVYAPDRAGGVPTYTAITLDKLYDATENRIGEGTTAQITAEKTALAGKQGWYIWLKTKQPDNSYIFDGEKVMTSSVTLEGVLVFPTYSPNNTNANSCSVVPGQVSAYMLNLYDGTPVADQDMSGGALTRSDRRKDLKIGGIPSEPTVQFSATGDPVIRIGLETLANITVNRAPVKTYWKVQ